LKTIILYGELTMNQKNFSKMYAVGLAFVLMGISFHAPEVEATAGGGERKEGCLIHIASVTLTIRVDGSPYFDPGRTAIPAHGFVHKLYTRGGETKSMGSSEGHFDATTNQWGAKTAHQTLQLKHRRAPYIYTSRVLYRCIEKIEVVASAKWITEQTTSCVATRDKKSLSAMKVYIDHTIDTEYSNRDHMLVAKKGAKTRMEISTQCEYDSL